MNGNICISLLVTVVISVMMSSCSDHSRPDSLEPIMEIYEASDISRKEATVEACIHRRGSSALSYADLIYQPAGNRAEMKISGDPKSDRLRFRLSGLMPGTSYSCHLEAGTETASLKSATITFTTRPNERPNISSPVPLSTGPLGIIVQVTVFDDGGEELLEAGCEVRTLNASESRNVYGSPHPDHDSNLRVVITGLTPLTSYTITPFASNAQGKTYGKPLEYTTINSIVLQQPGELNNLFEDDPQLDLNTLTISGPMNGDDLRTLRSFLGTPEGNLHGLDISDIDLTDAIITEGGNSYDGQHFTISDCLSTGLFSGCARLRSAILPNSVVAIERDAFARCHALETFIVPPGVETLIPSADCPALKAIEVSKANNCFSSIEGVLFNQDATEIIWFPSAKTGEYTLPSTLKTIGENAFSGTSLTSLTIPSSVRSISRGAFSASAITEIRLPDGLANIPEGAFQNCSRLIYIYLGSGTRYVGDFAFDGTSIRDIYLAAETPPLTMEKAFRNGDSTIFGQCTLHIPIGSRDKYTNHTQWGSFTRIEEFQP
ncbi:MAG: leucine-rich repeat domain-containing protein [Muribaculaceae bacterium]|nr:leucine-rich repeat domain-containing protein [Muribaculaceae bacterium]